MSSNSKAAALLEHLETTLNDPQAIDELRSDALRFKLREISMKLSLSLEAVGDTVHRICNTPLQLILARIGLEKNIFEELSQVKGSHLTNEKLAARTKIDPILLKRLLRFYQAHGMISQPGDDAYSANNVTDGILSAGGRSGIMYHVKLVVPTYDALPQFLEETRYANPSDPLKCPWFIGHRTTLNPFVWLQSHPDVVQHFLPWMASQREGLADFLSGLDFKKELLDIATDKSAPAFVDIGGATGHQCVLLKNRYPELAGRIVLQDQPFIIDQVNANPIPGIKAQAYDFFTPQPVKGAFVYYLRCVLHDWPDHKCLEILDNVKAGMTENSVLLIDEMVLSERGAPARAAQFDFAMMTCLSAMERTEAQWRALLDKAGFQIQKIIKYTQEAEESIIMAIPR